MKKSTPKNNKMSKQFGDRLRSLRLDRGHTSLEAFALKNNISRVLFSNWERGKGNITLGNLDKVTKALDVSLKEFFAKGFE